MTEQTKNNLIESIEKLLDKSASEMDKLPRLFSMLETYKTIINTETNKESSELFESLGKLLNFRLIIGIITMDLCVATLIYLRGKFQYEAIYSMRQIIVIINEGYKKVYNFIIEKDNGSKILKYRNSSFWIKEIGAIVSKDLPKCQQKYQEITKKLDDYLDINFKTLKKQRDLSVHYDNESMTVYEMLIKLDDEKIFNKLKPFLSIINEMLSFTNELCQNYVQRVNQASTNVDKSLDDYIEQFEKLKGPQNEKEIDEFQKYLLMIKNLK